MVTAKLEEEKTAFSVVRDGEPISVSDISELMEGDQITADCTIGRREPVEDHMGNPEQKRVICGIKLHVYQGMNGDGMYKVQCQECEFVYGYTPVFLAQTLKKYNKED